MTALCRYSGLLNFPNDDLSCDLEFAGWTIDGRCRTGSPFSRGAWPMISLVISWGTFAMNSTALSRAV